MQYIDAAAPPPPNPEELELKVPSNLLAQRMQRDAEEHPNRYRIRGRQVKARALDRNDPINKVNVRHMPKIGRNETCPCGSGRKYKACHQRYVEPQR